MSDKMICPLCQKELVREGMNHWWCLCNLHHQGKELYGTTALWQELIRTKKQLEIAKKALNGVCYNLPWIKIYLKQIKELDDDK